MNNKAFKITFSIIAALMFAVVLFFAFFTPRRVEIASASVNGSTPYVGKDIYFAQSSNDLPFVYTDNLTNYSFTDFVVDGNLAFNFPITSYTSPTTSQSLFIVYSRSISNVFTTRSSYFYSFNFTQISANEYHYEVIYSLNASSLSQSVTFNIQALRSDGNVTYKFLSVSIASDSRFTVLPLRYGGYGVDMTLTGLQIDYIIYNIVSGSAYSSLYSRGYGSGYTSGYSQGVAAGKNEGYDDGYNKGYEVGYNAGWTAHSDDNTNIAYTTGYNAGYKVGYSAGQASIDSQFQGAWQDGYDSGFAAGEASGGAENASFMGLISAVVDAPIKAFTSLLDFEIFGVNLSSFLLALFSVCIILSVVRLVI